MPWGWECREKLIKQRVLQPTKRRGPVSQDIALPAPNHYEPTVVIGGPGFSNIKRLPAYTFGMYTPLPQSKPAAKLNAKMYDVSGLGRKGPFRIPGSVVTPHIEPPGSKIKNPGPAKYAPPLDSRYKTPPAYSIREVAHPPYQAWDMWTPPPNMYLPPLHTVKTRPPAYSLGKQSSLKPMNATTPGPGDHDPKFDYVKKAKPAYSFGYPVRQPKLPTLPAPNTYCEKKFNVSKRSAPAPSFGIRHSKYLGTQTVYEKPSNLKIEIAGV